VDPPSWDTRQSHQPVWTAVVKGVVRLIVLKGRGDVRHSADAEQYDCSDNAISVSSKTFYCWKRKLHEQAGETLCAVKESCMKEVGRDIENVSEYFILRQKPTTHAICWDNRFLMPG